MRRCPGTTLNLLGNPGFEAYDIGNTQFSMRVALLPIGVMTG